jgi:enterochelin esterase family protein
MLDPGNPLVMWGGYGPNSELRMPDYVYPMETVRREDVPRGTLHPSESFRSFNLGHEVAYRVYTPAGYDTLGALPSIYVTDGHEYAADHMGSMVIVLDNLIADGRIEPAVAVFIDPRDLENPYNNRRTTHYVANPSFVNYVADELIPAIDQKYKSDSTAQRRAILGTSLGGSNAAYFGATMPDLFGNVAIQSPAFGGWSEVYDSYRDPSLSTLKVFLSYGT